MRNDQRQRSMEIRGQMLPILPSQWQDDELTMQVAVALTPQEGSDMAQKMMMMHQVLSQDEDMRLLYGMQQKHALFDAVFDALGVADSTPYMGVPGSPEVVQQMQAMQQQAQEQQAKQDEMMAIQAQALTSNEQRQWAELNNKIMDTLQDNEREDKKFEWTQFVDMNEIEIEKNQSRAASIG